MSDCGCDSGGGDSDGCGCDSAGCFSGGGDGGHHSSSHHHHSSSHGGNHSSSHCDSGHRTESSTDNDWWKLNWTASDAAAGVSIACDAARGGRMAGFSSLPPASLGNFRQHRLVKPPVYGNNDSRRRKKKEKRDAGGGGDCCTLL